ncbi:unnamed protein product [Lota lota]
MNPPAKGREAGQRGSTVERMSFFGARNEQTSRDDFLAGADGWTTAKVSSRTRRTSDITGLRGEPSSERESAWSWGEGWVCGVEEVERATPPDMACSF